MRNNWLWAVATIATVLIVGTPARADRARTDDVLVTLRPNTNLARFAKDYGVRVKDQVTGTTTFRLSKPRNGSNNQLIKRMRRDQRVAAAGTNDPAGTPEISQWTTAFDAGPGKIAAAGQSALPQVNFGKAGSISRGSGTLVAVLDTGVSLRHEELAKQVVRGWNALDGSQDTDDMPRRVDTNHNDIKDEATGHGTMIAGIINQMAPDAQILPVKVLDSDGFGTVWDTVEGITYAIGKGADVINLSLAATVDSDVLKRALSDAVAHGVLVVTSAGNQNSEIPQVPAMYSTTISVAALDSENRKASFSNYGSHIDLSAPGVEVISTYWDGRYVSWSGTSFSVAFVSAEAALLRSLVPRASIGQVVKWMQDSSREIEDENPGYRGKLGKEGLIDIDAAVDEALDEIEDD